MYSYFNFTFCLVSPGCSSIITTGSQLCPVMEPYRENGRKGEVGTKILFQVKERSEMKGDTAVKPEEKQ